MGAAVTRSVEERQAMPSADEMRALIAYFEKYDADSLEPRSGLSEVCEALRWTLGMLGKQIGMTSDGEFASHRERMRRSHVALSRAYQAAHAIAKVREFLESIDDCGEPYAERDAALEALRHV